MHEPRACFYAIGEAEVNGSGIRRRFSREEDHERLLENLLACKGRVMVSGYTSGLYDRALRRLHRREFEVQCSSGTRNKKRDKTEVVWLNYRPQD